MGKWRFVSRDLAGLLVGYSLGSSPLLKRRVGFLQALYLRMVGGGSDSFSVRAGGLLVGSKCWGVSLNHSLTLS